MLTSCTTKKSNTVSDQPSISKYIEENNDCDSVIVSENKAKTFSLFKCLKFQDQRTSVNFFIYTIDSDSLVHQNSIANGDVYWVTDEIIKIDRVEGIESESDNNDYFFNVSNSTRTNKPINNQR